MKSKQKRKTSYLLFYFVLFFIIFSSLLFIEHAKVIQTTIGRAQTVIPDFHCLGSCPTPTPTPASLHTALCLGACPTFSMPQPTIPKPTPTTSVQKYAVSDSSVWSGYSYDSVLKIISSEWYVPKLICDRNQGFMSNWVGMGNSNIAQLGTEEVCAYSNNKLTGFIEAITEAYPAPPIFIKNPVSVGDHMYARVIMTSPGHFSTTLINLTRQWKIVLPMQFGSWIPEQNEIIVESYPNPSNGLVVRPKYLPTTFFNNGISIDGKTLYKLQGANHLRKITNSSNGKPNADTGDLLNNQFTITWRNY